MELSKYNVTSYVDSGIIVFNTLTSAIVKMSSEEWDIVRKGDLNNIPSEIASQLLCMGIITDKSDSQIFQYKYEFYKNAFESKTPFLYVAPTMNCNFRCFYCFEEGHKHQATMTEETALKIVRFLKVQNKNEVNIVWFGGEPMLGFDLIMFLCRQLQNEGIDYTSSMITNGSLFTETNTKSLHLLNLKFIQISMDGVGETHDRRRCFINGKPSFSIIINNLERILSTTDIPVVIQITMDHQNPSAYDDLRNFCLRKFPQYIENGRLEIGFNNVQNRTGFDKTGSCFSPEDLISDEIFRISADENPYVRIPALSNPCMYRTSWYLAIDSQGNLYKCIEQLGNPEERIGSLNDDFVSLKRLCLAAFQEEAFSDQECLNCPVFPICGGGCPLDRIKRANGETREVCSKYKDGLSRMLPAIYDKLKKR